MGELQFKTVKTPNGSSVPVAGGLGCYHPPELLLLCFRQFGPNCGPVGMTTIANFLDH
jgi:hypothetical protein